MKAGCAKALDDLLISKKEMRPREPLAEPKLRIRLVIPIWVHGLMPSPAAVCNLARIMRLIFEVCLCQLAGGH